MTLARMRRQTKRPRGGLFKVPELAFDRARKVWFLRGFPGHTLPASEPGYPHKHQALAARRQIIALRRVHAKREDDERKWYDRRARIVERRELMKKMKALGRYAT